MSAFRVPVGVQPSTSIGHQSAATDTTTGPIPRPPVHRLAAILALSLIGLTAASCGATPETRGLKKLRIAEPGVVLTYQLEPGTALNGHLRLGNTRRIDGLDKPLSQAVECDVTLVVAPQAETGMVRLGATFANIDLAWGLPPASSFASDDFRVRALETLRGYRGWIEIDDRGRVVAVSPLPERAAPEVLELIGALLDTVEASFVPTPAAAVGRGDDWQSTHVLQTVDGSVAMTLEGLFRHKKRDEPMALLTVAYDEERQATTSTGTETRGRQGEARVLYATDGGYVAEIDRELTAFAPSRGMSYEKLRVTWQLVRGMMPTELASPTDDLQVISDPCNLDYVGPDACPTQLQPMPEPAAEVPRETVEPSPDAPKADAPKADAPKADAPKADAPKADAPKADPAKADAPKADPPKADPAKADPVASPAG